MLLLTNTNLVLLCNSATPVIERIRKRGKGRRNQEQRNITKKVVVAIITVMAMHLILRVSLH